MKFKVTAVRNKSGEVISEAYFLNEASANRQASHLEMLFGNTINVTVERYKAQKRGDK